MNKPLSVVQKEERKDKILSIAYDLFLEEGIEKVKMTDIASSSYYGVATLYRYFQVKKNIVIECGIRLWNEKYREFKKLAEENEINNLPGYENVASLLYHFYDIYNQDKRFFKFLNEFDNFCMNEHLSLVDLEEYEKTILKIHQIFMKIGKKSQEENTIRPDINLDTIYFTATHSLLGLCQKLINNKNILSSDLTIKDTEQIEEMLKIILRYMKA